MNDLASERNVRGVDERYHVCAFGVVGEASITEVCDFLQVGVHPAGSVFIFAQMAVLLDLAIGEIYTQMRM